MAMEAGTSSTRRLRERRPCIYAELDNEEVEMEEDEVVRPSRNVKKSKKSKVEVSVENLYLQKNPGEASNTALETIYESPMPVRGRGRQRSELGEGGMTLTGRKLKRLCLFPSHYNPGKQKTKLRKDRARRMKQLRGVVVPQGRAYSKEDVERVLLQLSEEEEEQKENNLNATFTYSPNKSSFQHSPPPPPPSSFGFCVGRVILPDTSGSALNTMIQDMKSLCMGGAFEGAKLDVQDAELLCRNLLSAVNFPDNSEEVPQAIPSVSKQRKMRRRSGRVDVSAYLNLSSVEDDTPLSPSRLPHSKSPLSDLSLTNQNLPENHVSEPQEIEIKESHSEILLSPPVKVKRTEGGDEHCISYTDSSVEVTRDSRSKSNEQTTLELPETPVKRPGHFIDPVGENQGSRSCEVSSDADNERKPQRRRRGRLQKGKRRVSGIKRPLYRINLEDSAASPNLSSPNESIEQPSGPVISVALPSAAATQQTNVENVGSPFSSLSSAEHVSCRCESQPHSSSPVLVSDSNIAFNAKLEIFTGSLPSPARTDLAASQGLGSPTSPSTVMASLSLHSGHSPPAVETSPVINNVFKKQQRRRRSARLSIDNSKVINHFGSIWTASPRVAPKNDGKDLEVEPVHAVSGVSSASQSAAIVEPLQTPNLKQKNVLKKSRRSGMFLPMNQIPGREKEPEKNSKVKLKRRYSDVNTAPVIPHLRAVHPLQSEPCVPVTGRDSHSDTGAVVDHTAPHSLGSVAATHPKGQPQPLTVADTLERQIDPLLPKVSRHQTFHVEAASKVDTKLSRSLNVKKNGLKQKIDFIVEDISATRSSLNNVVRNSDTQSEKQHCSLQYQEVTAKDSSAVTSSPKHFKPDELNETPTADCQDLAGPVAALPSAKCFGAEPTSCPVPPPFTDQQSSTPPPPATISHDNSWDSPVISGMIENRAGIRLGKIYHNKDLTNRIPCHHIKLPLQQAQAMQK